MKDFESSPLNREKLSPDDWRSQVIWPMIRNASRDDFKDRESSESNPTNYVVEIFPKPDPNHLDQSGIYRNILRGKAVSGIVDLRLNNEGKYTIWLGINHRELMVKGAQVPNDPNIDQYLISIKLKEGKEIQVSRTRENVGQSCDRTPEQITKVLDAVDAALKNSLQKRQ